MKRDAGAEAVAAQIRASDPDASAFVAANAGSGKTSTLVTRVARLLLTGAAPETILCVTFTKAAAAEMQTRLYQRLGGWAVMRDADLTRELAGIEEGGRDLAQARALFARALETPGGLKIQTIHAFCEKLLRRFPLEAGVLPGFEVLEDAAALKVSQAARDAVGLAALAEPDSALGQAYARLAVDLDYRAFEGLFGDFETKRAAIARFVRRCAAGDGLETEVFRRCGLEGPVDIAGTEALALKRAATARWRRTADELAASGAPTDRTLAEKMRSAAHGDFQAMREAFLKRDGEPLKTVGTKQIAQETRDWLKAEQARVAEAAGRISAARWALASLDVLRLAIAYADIYAGAKADRGALDFGDLIERASALLTGPDEAAWVLYKLDAGLSHILVDEAQDTSPDQWEILRALSGEFFHGQGAGPEGRTLFAVGDEKQSIFSFQGAAPEQLARQRDAFGVMAAGAGAAFKRVPLLESWRSTPEILTAVDAVFADDEARVGLRASGDNVEPGPLEHRPIRAEHGCVELWPLEADREDETEPDYWAPLDREPPLGANRLLATRIAQAIGEMVRAGELVVDPRTREARPCRYGDVMILVRRRKALFHEIIRALKRAGVAVAGADRLKLSEHAVFKDLMAFGRVVRFPADDLSLAVILRSPLCDVDEDSLFDLAHGREGGLWAELGRRADERAEWAAARDLIAWGIAAQAEAAPFDFYCALLARLDGAGRSMRQRVLTRLSAEGEQALDGFISQALAAEAVGVRDLESLLDWLTGLELEIKREQPEGSAGQVRVMTAHGAKGLEAPVVILPDTTTKASWQGGRLLTPRDGAILWAVSQADNWPFPEGLALARAERDAGVDAESARLLYVAMTRARDRLIVAGVKVKSRFAGSWYDYVARAFERLPAAPFALPGGGEGHRFGRAPERGGAKAAAAPDAALPPDWARRIAPAETTARRASPSHFDDQDMTPAPSPLDEAQGLGRWRRGDLIHKLFERLPDIVPEQRAEAARRMLAREPDLDDAQRAEMAGAALAVLGDQRFAAVFGPGSRAEVAVVGTAAALPADRPISGRIDRLLVEAERVLVVDFKTNRPAPKAVAGADPGYVLQLAIYAAVLGEIYPGRRIEAALVWTDGPALMPVPNEMMEAAVAGLST